MKNSLLFIIILSVGAVLVSLIHWNTLASIRAEKAAYRVESHGEAILTAERVEYTFQEIYSSLRTIARLPSVREYRATEFDDKDLCDSILDANTCLTVQELYNALASEVAVSELYIVPVEFDPDGLDPTHAAPREPITTFDELIIGRTGGDGTTSHGHGEAPVELEEIEIFEYRLMRTQLDWMLEHTPIESHIEGLAYPVLSGPPVVTCDNSRFDPHAPNDSDREGLVLSVPFFDLDGKLAGSISAVILTHALSDHFETGDYALFCEAQEYLVPPPVQGQWTLSRGAGRDMVADDQLLYSEILTVRTPPHSSTWVLWAGHADSVFWKRPAVRVIQRHAITLILASLIGCCAGTFILLAFLRRRQTQIRLIAERDHADTENMQFQRALHDLENLKKTLDEHAIVSMTDIKGNITFVNDKFVEISGYSREELIGQNHRMVKSDEHDRAFYQDLWCTVASKQTWSGEVKNRAKNGGSYWVLATIVPFTDESGKIEKYVAIRTDITDRKQSEELLQAVNAQLMKQTSRASEMAQKAESASKAKSDFLANMSHEIRTPMTAILGFTDTLREEGDISLAPKQRIETIDTIHRNGQHLLNLINDILDLSKIEAGKMEVELIACNPCSILEEAAELVKNRAEAKGLSFDVEYLGDIPETIHTDPTRLRQILINLVGNAIKFTEQGGIKLITRLVRDGDTSSMQFDVLDSGIGMTHEHIAGLFRPFVQADNSTTRKFGGTGLGLTISKRFAEMLGGNLTIAESQIGVGTRFRATVETGPLDGVKMIKMPKATMAQVGKQTASAPKVDIAGRRVLVAEDGPDNQRLISFILKKAGAEVVILENGKLALDAALAARDEGKAFDVILMDMQMPVMSGYEATAALREASYTGPIIALTAHAMAGDRKKCLNAGCDDFANKPIDRAKLIALIAAYSDQAAKAA